MAPVCQAHDKKYILQNQKTQTTKVFDSSGFLLSIYCLSI